nr:hypothetical protein [Lysinibacillus timonensis]
MEVYRNIGTLFDEAIMFDEPYAAHYIYFAVMKGKVTFLDSVEKLYRLSLSEEEEKEFQRMRAKDVLNMRPIKIYAIKCSADCYAFYFASNALEARELHFKHYGQLVNKITSCYNQMIDTSIYYPASKQTKSFRELMKEKDEIPCLVVELEEK